MIPILIEVLGIDIHIHPLKSDFPYHRDDKGKGNYKYKEYYKELGHLE